MLIHDHQALPQLPEGQHLGLGPPAEWPSKSWWQHEILSLLMVTECSKSWRNSVLIDAETKSQSEDTVTLIHQPNDMAVVSSVPRA